MMDTHAEEFVDAILRSLNAAPGRKTRIREELLGHWRQAYEAERDAGADEEASAKAAFQRLGDGEELRRELQAAVPRFERLMYRRMGLRRADESDARYAARMALWYAAPTILFAAAALLMCPLLTSRGLRLGQVWPALAFVCGHPAVIFAAFYGDLRWQQALRGGYRTKALLLMSVFWCGFGVFGFGVCSLMAVALPQMWPYLPLIGGICAAAAVALAAFTYLCGSMTLRRCSWVRLGEHI